MTQAQSLRSPLAALFFSLLCAVTAVAVAQPARAEIQVNVNRGDVQPLPVAVPAFAGGLGAVHWSVHAMLATGLAMMAIYGHLRFAAYPRLRRAVEAREFPAAGAALPGIRRLVNLNLALGVAVFALAIVGPATGAGP